MFNRRHLTEAEVAAAIKSAVADATTGAVLSSHIAQCEGDKKEIREALAKQQMERERMHAENTVRFAQLQRVVWMAAGGVTLIGALLSTQFGSSIMAKILH